MKLFIDNSPADLEAGQQPGITITASELTTAGAAKIERRTQLWLPATKCNDALLGFCGQLRNAGLFNHASREARLEKDGCTVLRGQTAFIRYETGTDGRGRYLVEIVRHPPGWLQHAAGTAFRQTLIDFNEKIGEETIRESWTWDKPVRFLPVHRDRPEDSEPVEGLFSPSKLLSAADYHPFINCRALMEAIFAESGYKIRSQFCDSDLFGSLYMSGNFPVRNISAIKNRMDFLAGRTGAKSAAADRYGRVFADPSTTFNSVGNIVEIADASTGNSHGETFFNTNGCFRMTLGKASFAAPYAVTMGFELRIKYRTQYLIGSRERLKCFDTIHLDDSDRRHFPIANTHIDRRGEYMAMMDYTIVVFDFVEGDTFQLRHNVMVNPGADPGNPGPGDMIEQTVATFVTRSAAVGTYSSEMIVNPKLYIKYAGMHYFVPYGLDWALYDGLVADAGEITVDVTVRTAIEKLSPGTPRYFDLVAFSGAEQGMTLTLDAATTLRPVFYPHPYDGGAVRFAELAAHKITQLDFIRSMEHMFNLRFMTDPLSGEVFIEPSDDLVSLTEPVDWTGRIDTGKPVAVEEASTEQNIRRKQTYCYRDGDGTVKRLNETTGDKIGEWSVKILNNSVREGERRVENPLFTPAVNRNDTVVSAPSAYVLRVGDSDSDTSDLRAENLNFVPKIVRYMGLADLPAAEAWIWPGINRHYPLAAFHLPALPDGTQPKTERFTLCFEDRDGITGLHKMYDKELAAFNYARSITAYMTLDPADIEAIVVPNRLGRDLRALYKLRIDGEEGLFRLVSIEGYSPAGECSTKCRFIQEL